MIDFAALTKQEFDELARQGVVGPYGNDFSCVGAVIKGLKPIAWVDEAFAKFSVSKFRSLKMRVIPSLVSFRERNKIKYEENWNHFAYYGVFQHTRAFRRLCRVFERYGFWNNTLENALFNIELGRALGYSEGDIAAFLKHNFGYKKMIKSLTHNAEIAINCPNLPTSLAS